MSTQPESSKSTGPTCDGGETHERSPQSPLTSGSATLSAADSPASQFRVRENGKAKVIRDGSGRSSGELSVSFDLDMSLLKMCQDSTGRAFLVSSLILPRSGTMRNGIAYRLPPLVPRISGTGCSLLPTPTANDWKGPNMSGSGSASCNGLATHVKMWPTPTTRDHKDGTAKSCQNVPENGLLGRAIHCRNSPEPQVEISGSLNPTWVELLMGFPAGWTDISDEE